MILIFHLFNHISISLSSFCIKFDALFRQVSEAKIAVSSAYDTMALFWSTMFVSKTKLVIRNYVKIV
ncbi:hypothetical protein FF38_00662 [Lucilia cuprina]|uniref:Uncharacterized protein n=1 Tax=Lucilia cuprina TaxID=7375 RepID=A0A0L0CRD5_LUCCU|nr:hypothetical protein FF38_00662 [Lucilia cuprina]